MLVPFGVFLSGIFWLRRHGFIIIFTAVFTCNNIMSPIICKLPVLGMLSYVKLNSKYWVMSI